LNARGWWYTRRSLQEIAEHLESIVTEKQDIERRLKEVLDEKNALRIDTIRLKSEIETVQGQLQGGQRAELAAKEKLIKDDFERRVQALKTDFQKERHQLLLVVQKMKKELSGCICRRSL
jgi:hypothetical protein